MAGPTWVGLVVSDLARVTLWWLALARWVSGCVGLGSWSWLSWQPVDMIFALRTV